MELVGWLVGWLIGYCKLEIKPIFINRLKVLLIESNN
jgi:hypothetical protein